MNPKHLLLLPVVLWLLPLALVLAAPEDKGVGQLMAIDEFALGGVGYGGTESKGEEAFRKVLQDPKAVEKFKKILRTGTPAAQLYALCGIRMLDRKELEMCAVPLIKQEGRVMTMNGCFFGKEPIADVTRKICNGGYDPWLLHPRW